MRGSVYRRWLMAFFALLLMGWAGARSSLEAQEGKIEFWGTNRGLEIQSAMSVIGAGSSPLLGLDERFSCAWGARMLAGENANLEKWQVTFDEPLPIDHRYLRVIKDDRPLPVVRIDQNNPKLPPVWTENSPEWGWYRAFNDALSRADEADMEMFKKGAKELEHVVYADLRDNPIRYRGRIITVTGKVTIIRKKDAPRFVPDTIAHIYESYVVTNSRLPPYAIAFTHLPEGIDKEGDNLNLQVTFHGYFLSIVRFPPEKGNKAQKEVISPYLVGRTLIVNAVKKAPVLEEKESYSYYIIVLTLGGILVIAVLVVVLSLWFKRGDRAVQAQLAQMREKHQPFSLEPDEAPNDSAAAPNTGTSTKPADDATPPATS